MRRRTFLGTTAALVLGACGLARPDAPTGRRLKRIGFLSGNLRESVDIRAGVLIGELATLGYVEGRDIEIVDRLAENKNELLPEMARELVTLPVDLIVAEAGPAQNAALEIRAALGAVDTIPLILTLGPELTPGGLVDSLARPGRNLTGASHLNNVVMAKKLEVLNEVAPSVRRVAIIYNANTRTGDSAKYAQEEGRGLHLDVSIYPARDPRELETALARIADDRNEAIATTALLSVVGRELAMIPEFANRHRMPQIFGDIQFIPAGGLMYFNVSFADIYRWVAGTIDRIFRGAAAGEIPVHEPATFELVINLATARRIGLTIPDAVLRRANQVIP